VGHFYSPGGYKAILKMRRRFALRLEKDLNKSRLENKDSASTKKATKQVIKVPEEFCYKKQIATDFN
jgi:hypothetical protein